MTAMKISSAECVTDVCQTDSMSALDVVLPCVKIVLMSVTNAVMPSAKTVCVASARR